jgi:methyltransferase (TIGR00027 family)
VVLLGAGYDTRAYRFASALHGRPVFELDFPATSRRKARIVAEHARELPATDVRHVEIDFLNESLDDALIRSGFQRGAQTFFIWEGVTMYLTRSAVKDTLARVHDLGGGGSRMALDFWYLLDAADLLSSVYRTSAGLLSLVGEPALFALHPEDAAPFMRHLGFEIVDLANTDELRRRYVRDGRHVFPGNYVLEARAV